MSSKPTDRYVTYANIDCEGNAKRLMQMLRKHIDDPTKSNPFWEKFKARLDRIGQPTEAGDNRHDEIFLIHNYINNLYEIFEDNDDSEALALLNRIERECC